MIEVSLLLDQPKLRFSSVERAKEWAAGELAFWDTFSDVRSHSLDPETLRWDYVRQALENVASLASDIDHAQAQATVSHAVDRLKLLSRDPRAQFVQSLHDRGEDPAVVANTLLAFISPTVFANFVRNVQTSVTAVRALASAAAWYALPTKREVSDLKNSFAAQSSEWRAALDEAYARMRAADDELQRWRDATATTLSGQQDRFETALREFADERESIKRRLSVDLALRAPVDYWSTKASNHRTEASTFRKWFTAIGIGGLILLGAGAFFWLIPIMERAGDAWWALALFSVLIALWAWPLRLTSKLYLSNRHLAEDAAEREVITKTFLALSESVQMADDDRKILLAALFRSANGGLVKDEGNLSFSDLVLTKLAARE